jgi:hypothetical protein
VDFDVDLVQDIRWNDRAFESLALPGDYKHLLLSLARSQGKGAAQFDDVIEGKGTVLGEYILLTSADEQKVEG